MLSWEATNNNIIFFGLTRPGLEPTIYRTRGQYTDHFTHDAVQNYSIYFQINTYTEYAINKEEF